jgi:predicted DNA-binding protein YlxM (UPF0122 family)
MYEKKNNPIDRKNYYLTPEQKKEIRDYVIAHPDMPQIKIAEHFGVSRTVVYNIHNAPLKREYYEKEISRLTNQLNRAADNIFKLQNEILKLKRK